MPPSADPNTEYARLSSEMFKTWEKAMGAWWDQVLETPSFLGAVNQNLGGAAKARGAYTQAVDAAMQQAHLPTRGDVVRMLKVATMLEDRLLAQEDLLLELRDRLAAAEKEALQARIEATEARIESRERLDALVGRLEALVNGVAAAAPVAPTAPATTPSPTSGEATPRRKKPEA